MKKNRATGSFENGPKPIYIVAALGTFLVLVLLAGRSSMDVRQKAQDNRIDLNTMEANSDVSDPKSSWVQLLRQARTAAMTGDTDTARNLFAHGLKVDDDLGGHTTLLMLAAQNDRIDMVRFLIRQGARQDIQDLEGNTAVLLAAKNRHSREVMYLLEQSRANIDAILHYKYPGFQVSRHTAAGNGAKPGPQVAVPGLIDEEATLLMIAAKNGDLRLARSLVDLGADVNVRNRHGDSALSWAVAFGDLPIVEFLISRNADVNVHGDARRTPLAIARMRRFEVIARALLKAGAK